MRPGGRGGEIVELFDLVTVSQVKCCWCPMMEAGRYELEGKEQYSYSNRIKLIPRSGRQAIQSLSRFARYPARHESYSVAWRIFQICGELFLFTGFSSPFWQANC